MVNCPVCGKFCKTPFGLEGHIRFTNDNQHEQYRGHPRPQHTRKRKRKYEQKATPQPDTNRVDELEQQNIQLRQQFIQLELKQHKLLQELQQASCQQAPVQQTPAQQAPVQQALDKERQRVEDAKAEQELLVMMKEEMNGGVTHDHAIMNKAPKSIRRALWQHHLHYDDEDE